MDIAISTGLDLLIVIIFIVSIIIGLNKGLVRTIISLFGKIVALILAFAFSANLGVYIDDNYIRTPMKQWLVNELSPTAENVSATLQNLDMDSLFAEKPEFFTNLMDFLNIDLTTAQSQYEMYKQNDLEQAKAAITDVMISPLSAMISRVIAFAVIFIICCIAIGVLWWLSDLIINLPILRQLDKLGGFFVGVLNAVIITFIAVSIINMSSHYVLKDKTLAERQKIRDNTILYEFFTGINPLNQFFGEW